MLFSSSNQTDPAIISKSIQQNKSKINKKEMNPNLMHKFKNIEGVKFLNCEVIG